MMDYTVEQIDDYELMEPSPSPSAVAQAADLDPYPFHSQRSYDTRSDDMLWASSASPPSPSLSRPQNNPAQTHSRGRTVANPATSEADLSSRAQHSTARSSSHSHSVSHGRRNRSINRERLRSSSTVGGATGPLSARSLNELWVPYQDKPCPGPPGGGAVPAPVFTWQEEEEEEIEDDSVRHMSDSNNGQAGNEEMNKQHCRKLRVAPRQGSSSSQPLTQERKRVSGSTPQQRRSSVLGPDPHDCIDLCDDDVTEEEEEVHGTSPPPGEVHHAALALSHDLSALVNADSVDRCRSNSCGQVNLIDIDIPDHVTEEAVDSQNCSELAHSTDYHGEAGSDTDDDASSSFQFEHEYFYYPATSPDVEIDGEGSVEAASVLQGAQTPRRTISPSSASPSMPRWVSSLAEETPFTPFPPSAAGVATATPSFLPTSPAKEAEEIEEQVRQGLFVASATSQQQSEQHRIPTQHLSVHELVGALLASPPTCTGTVSNACAPVLEKAPTPMSTSVDEADSTSDDQLEEPLPRPPPDDYNQRTLTEEEQLSQRVQESRARLAHIDQLIARFDLVVEARQAELENLRGKLSVLTQQTESYKSRTSTATKEVRRLRERQHGQDEVRLLSDMMTDKENRLRVARSQLSSLQRLWKNLQLLCTTKTEEATEEIVDDVEGTREDSTASNPPTPTTCRAATDAAQVADSEGSPQEGEGLLLSPTSSDASLNTCNVLGEFLEELMSEVEGLAKICIQLPSAPPPPHLHSCKGSHHPSVQNPDDTGSPDSEHTETSRPQTTCNSPNRRLTKGNNGFFSFFGGATEAHLDSKPLSTFLANLNRLARTSWEREEELQLRSRELATEEEEDDLKTRLAAELGIKLQHMQSPLSVSALSQAAKNEHLNSGISNDVSTSASSANFFTPKKSTAAASADHTKTQPFLSSPEHGRRSHCSSLESPTLNGTATAPPLMRSRISPIPLLLPTLVYAYPRIAAVSQNLDVEQQKIQADYAAAIEAERQSRRQLTARLRDAYRLHVAPMLRRSIDALRQQQMALAKELADLGVKAVTIQWEEEETEVMNDDTLLQAIDEATATAQNPLSAIKRYGGARDYSRNRASRRTAPRESEANSYGDTASSHGASLAPWENSTMRSRTAAVPPCDVYRRTLNITCMRESIGAENSALMPFASSQPPSGRHPREPTMHQIPRSARPSSGRGCLSARSPRNRPSSTPRPSVTPAEQNTLSSLTKTAASTSSRRCPALQLCTNSLSKTLLDRNGVRVTADEEERTAVTTAINPALSPIATACLRRSGGTPRASGASATARSSTANWSERSSRGHAIAAVLSSPRHRHSHSHKHAATISSSATGHNRRHSRPASCDVSARADRPSAHCSPSEGPVIEDVRELVTPADVRLGVSTSANVSTPTATRMWTPFERTQRALSDGAVRVAITFSGKEARRRQATHSRREAYQREFWELREELARIDEDTFQLRTHWIELQSVHETTVTEQRAKLMEARAKRKKCRSFYELVRRENKDWKSIREELERVIHNERKELTDTEKSTPRPAFRYPREFVLFPQYGKMDYNTDALT